ncbi:MAG: PaaI family thioesterase [Pseudomonadota bacterium]
MEQSHSKISLSQFAEISDQRLPFAALMGLQLDKISADRVLMRAVYREAFLRPGGTIAGPVMMGLADAAMYALVLANIGPVELAVTTNLNINFLRKPAPGDVIGSATPLKFGKRLAIGEIALYSEKAPQDIVAHAMATYSIPPSAN